MLAVSQAVLHAPIFAKVVPVYHVPPLAAVLSHGTALPTAALVIEPAVIWAESVPHAVHQTSMADVSTVAFSHQSQAAPLVPLLVFQAFIYVKSEVQIVFHPSPAFWFAALFYGMVLPEPVAVESLVSACVLRALAAPAAEAVMSVLSGSLLRNGATRVPG